MDISTEELTGTVYYHLASFVILYYDHFLVLDDELRYFWQSKFSWTTVLLLAIRYLAFVGHLPLVFRNIHASHLDQKACNDLVLYQHWLIVAIQLPVGVLLTMRVYALTRFSKIFLRIISVVIVACVAVASWAISETYLSSGVKGHDIAIDMGAGGWSCLGFITPRGTKFLSLPWIALLTFDSVILLFTVYSAKDSMKTGSESIAAVLVRDGALYFLILALANFSNIITFYKAPDVLQGVSTNFPTIISVIMISRLMINLKKRVAAIPGVYMCTDTRIGTLICVPGEGERDRAITDTSLTA